VSIGSGPGFCPEFVLPSHCDVDDEARSGVPSCGEFVLIGSAGSSPDGTSDMLPEHSAMLLSVLCWHSLSIDSLQTSSDDEVEAVIASPVFETGKQGDDVSVCTASLVRCWDCDTTGMFSDEWISDDIPVLCTEECVLLVMLSFPAN